MTAEQRAERRRELKRRFYAAIILAPLALIAAWFGGAPFVLVLLACAIIVFLEWRRITGEARWGVRSYLPLGALALAALMALAVGHAAAWVALIALSGVGAVIAVAKGQRPWLAIGGLYAGLLMLCMVAVRGEGGLGAAAMFWLLLTVWAADVCAYFVGRSVGGPKLWPRVSPSKTWSGALGGLAGALMIGALFVAFGPATGAFAFVAFTGVVAMIAMAGDLLESSIKRRFKVKDASRLIPGHGGLMDRADSLVAASAFCALVALLRGADDIPTALLVW